MTAEELIDKKYIAFEDLDNGNIWVNIESLMVEFAKYHVDKVKNLQECKYLAGETGYITKTEWEEILNNII